MKRLILIRLWRTFVAIIILAILCLGFARLITFLYSRSRTFNLASAPSRRVAIVFGAGLRRDGLPTPVLQDRIETAAQLYFEGKVEKLLMSGDNRFEYYNEPGAMRDYALSLGVPESALVLDYAGRSTYDTCYRARHIFALQEAILVTQSFHLPRAIYTCNALGIKGVGVPTDIRRYRLLSHLVWNLREVPATVNAFWQVHIHRPLPVLGNPEPIFSD